MGTHIEGAPPWLFRVAGERPYYGDARKKAACTLVTMIGMSTGTASSGPHKQPRLPYPGNYKRTLGISLRTSHRLSNSALARR